MKLLTYDTGSGPRCGALQDEYVADVSALLGTAQTLRDVRALLETGASASSGSERHWRKMPEHHRFPWRRSDCALRSFSRPRCETL
jgi:hypothetical protein